MNRLRVWASSESLDTALGSLLDAAELYGVVAWVRRPGKLARSAYHIPILDALRRKGGTADVGAVITEVKERMVNEFLADDMAFLPSGGPRWQKEANFAAEQLSKSGFLIKLGNPRGRWQITNEGLDFLQLN